MWSCTRSTPLIIRSEVDVLCVLFWTQPACMVQNQNTRNIYLQADDKRCTFQQEVSPNLVINPVKHISCTGALLVVGGTGKNNMSVSTVEMLPLDDPINSGCKSVASLPNKLDRAVGANFFPFYPISQSRVCANH